MTKFEELNAMNSTIVEWKGKELKTTVDPYIMTLATNNEDVYTAPALDSEGNQYAIYWTIDNPDATDESDVADWENPLDVYAYQWKFIN